MRQVRVLEELEVFTPLGIRFWDPVFDRQVRTGLRVEAWPERGLRPRVRAYRTQSDIYAFQGLPGLIAVEHRLIEQAAGSPADRTPFIVQVADEEYRFLTASFHVELPLPDLGIFLSAPRNNGSQPPSGFHLYSAPTRSVPSWMAVVSGELAVEADRSPAAHALLRLTVGEQRWWGAADEQGRFSVVFPYPPLEDGLGGSPLSPGRRMLSERDWEYSLQVRFTPAVLEKLPGSSIPAYPSILSQQSAYIWEAVPVVSGVPSSELSSRLRYGRPEIVRTEGLSKLLVSPSGSP